MKEGAESVQTKIQAKAESMLKGADLNKGKRLSEWIGQDRRVTVYDGAGPPNSSKKPVKHSTRHHSVVDQSLSPTIKISHSHSPLFNFVFVYLCGVPYTIL